MKYLGGKGRMATKLARFVKQTAGDRTVYVEPFVGGGFAFAQIAPLFETSIAADAHRDVIELWRAVAAGWVPPTEVTEAQWRELKVAEPSALRAFAGFGCSFAGRWFEGYARDGRGDDYAGQAARGIEKKRAAFEGAAAILHCDYADLTPLMSERVVAYCDPPYEGTKGYSGMPAWDSARWWATARTWREAGALVLVSEFSAPDDWRSVAWLERKLSIRDAAGVARTDLELVFA